MLVKETFISVLNKIKEQDAKVERFSKALGEMCDGYPIFDSDNGYKDALFEMLKEDMCDENDFISWWLYEDVEKKVWNDSKVWVLDTPEQLYDFLVEEYS